MGVRLKCSSGPFVNVLGQHEDLRGWEFGGQVGNELFHTLDDAVDSQGAAVNADALALPVVANLTDFFKFCVVKCAVLAVSEAIFQLVQ